ncbi:MAG: tetratricopeptide repeat protein [Fimbriiglobus sp.]
MAMSDPELYVALAQSALAAGRGDVAGELLRRLVTLPNPATPEQGFALHSQAITHLQAGRRREAEQHLLAAIRACPHIGSWVDHLGVVYAQDQRFAEAEVTFRLATQIEPTNSSPWRNLLQACMDRKKWPEALAASEGLIALEPHYVDHRLQQAVILCEMKRFEDAENLMQTLIRDGHQSANVWNRLGVLRGMKGDAVSAIDCFEKQIALEPESGMGYANLAAAFGKCNRWVEAAEAGEKAVRLEPQNGGGWANLGNAYRDLGRLPEAMNALQQAIRLEPHSHESFGNYALCLAMLGRVPEALTWYDEALRRKQDAAEVRFNRAIAYLSIGDFERGWVEYEWRWRTDQMKGQTRNLPTKPWRGEPLVGKTILLHTEQGHGDTIQFLKLVPQLKALGAKVWIVTMPILADLIRTMPSIDSVYLSGEAVPTHDFHAPLMSLPLLLKLRLNTIPSTAPHFTAPAEAISRWQARVADLPRPLIGIAWQGNPQHIGDRWRSVKLAQFAPLQRLGTLVSLQKGHGADQLETASFPILDLGREIGDSFADTAGLLMNLDRIITIDSALAHLSGALARPVSILLPLNSDWRWLQTRTDSPWYPTATLHRQTDFGQWPAVFARLADGQN